MTVIVIYKVVVGTDSLILVLKISGFNNFLVSYTNVLPNSPKYDIVINKMAYVCLSNITN